MHWIWHIIPTVRHEVIQLVAPVEREDALHGTVDEVNAVAAAPDECGDKYLHRRKRVLVSISARIDTSILYGAFARQLQPLT